MKKLVLALLLIASHATVMAQTPKVVLSDKDGWHKIGETTVDFKHEKDHIMVVGANRFAAVQIKVTDAPIHFISMDIHFDNGEMQTIPIGEEIKIAGETKSINLGGEKIIKKVTFSYKTIGVKNKDKKAHVELWGLKTNTDKK
jgi:hypothetical protein